MIIDRVFTPGLAQVAYMIADENAGEVAVIDPRRDVEVYTDWADTHGLTISAILETHVHADFVSGARELAAATGAPIYASRLGEQAFPHEPVDDGDDVKIGGLRLRALWTPGHTPEHLSYLLIDPTEGPEPRALFSGDALFVGEVGRPDLLGAEHTRRLAEQLYETVFERLAPLSPSLIVYPGHTAGSACGKKIGDAPYTSIGQEKLTNYAFQARSREAFIRMVLARMPPPPTYYPVLKRMNAMGPSLLQDLAPGAALAPDEIATRLNTGALVVDARSPESFGNAHIAGALSVGLGSDFPAWMGWLAPYDRDLVLVLDRDDQYVEARTELQRIGLDRVAGFLRGGMPAWVRSGLPVAPLPHIEVEDLAVRMQSPANGLLALDVRSDDEWSGGHIPHALHHYAGEIAQGGTSPVNPDQEIAVICASGYRSSVAASVLQRRGYQGVVNVAGGMNAWSGAGLPIEEGA